MKTARPRNFGSLLARLVPLAISYAAPVLSSAAVSDGLVHQWNFDESRDWHDSPYAVPALPGLFHDMVGGLPATPVGLDATAVVSGREFMALGFSGNGTKLQLAQNLAPVLGGTASFAFWMRTTASGGSDATNSPGVAGSTAGSGGIQWGWLDAAGHVCFSADATLLARSPAPVNDGEWHFVVLTRDAATGEARLFLDGQLADSRTGPGGARGLAFQSLGRIENASGNAGCFIGRLDKITIFNRVISPAEVAEFMANHAPKTWNLTTQGVNDRAFTTDSVFKRAYDVERDPLVVQGWTNPAQGTVAHRGDGSFTYTPTGAFTGLDSFDVTVSDGRGGYHRSTLTVRLIDEPPGGGGVPVTQFTNLAAVQAAGVDISHSGRRVPRAIDWDNDGRMDILVAAGSAVWRYMNTGTAGAPAFAAGVRVQANGSNINTGSSTAAIAITDMTGDGKPDLVVSASSSRLRVYPNTSATGTPPVYGSLVNVKMANGTTDFTMPDQRFDIGDWNGDGKPDLITGSFSGDMRLYLNANTAANPRFESHSVVLSDSYNIYPRLRDLDGNGTADLTRGINWGSIRYWLDPAGGLSGEQYLTTTTAGGGAVDVKALTDGAIVDFADFNGDGITDLLFGGHAGDKIYLSTGVVKTPAQSIAEIEAIYDANPTGLGAALAANNNALLNQINTANLNLITYLQRGTLTTRENLYAALTAHINKYAFLKYQELDTTAYRHVPSIVLQNWVMLEYLLPNTSTRRAEIADTMGLTGTMREIYLETGLALGDNGKSFPETYRTIRDFQRRHPRELFPDAILTTDQLYGDGRGGFVWTPNSTKNTFGQWALGNANEWAGDLTSAIEKVMGTGRASGDYFTFVMGHEVVHSLDNYVNTRANADLRRRWGLTLTTAAGPDIVAGANGWIDWNATRDNFIAKGLYNTATQTWRDGGANDAWDLYWSSGPGAAFDDLAFMRGNIGWFLATSQESLATQANHHWANAPGRIIGAIDRFRRGVESGNLPMKANINEVVTFIDFLSAGMNRINLVETKNPTETNVVWTDHLADLERDDNGRITRITLDGETYDFTVNADGVVVDVSSTVVVLGPDQAIALSGQGQAIDVLANDTALAGPAMPVESFTQPANGNVTLAPDGRLVYRSNPGFSGADSFTYSVAGETATVSVTVRATATGLRLETWFGISGDVLANLTNDARFPGRPDTVAALPTFESANNRADNYGARARGYITAPATGAYTFWIATDDHGQLWLSTNDDPANKALIASVTGWASSRQWTKFPSQQSAPVNLVAGQRYYIEALQKEGGGGDNLAVAWQGPGLAQQVIGSSHLGLFGVNRNPSATADVMATQVNVPVSIPVLANDSDPDNNPLVIQSITQPGQGTVVADGSSILFTPATDTSGVVAFSYAVSDGEGGTATANVTVNVNKVAQSLSFAPLPTAIWGDGPIALSATAGSGLDVVFGSSNPSVATISGNTLIITGAGSATITATQAGNAVYLPAEEQQTLVVSKAAQTITFPALPLKFTNDAPFDPVAGASSGLPVSFASSNPSVATISGTTVTITGPGTTTITASQPGDTNHLAATDVQRELVVNSAFGNGVWINPVGGAWMNRDNWQGGTIGDGAGNTANFATLDLASDAIVNLDGARTLGHVIFGDTNPSHSWSLAAGSGGPLTLDVATGQPTITVSANQSATIAAVLAGNDGISKQGGGTLVVTGAGTWIGSTTVHEGMLEVLAKSGNVAYTVEQGASLKLGYNTGGGYTPGITLNGNGVADPAGLSIKGGVNFQTNGGILIQTAPTTIRSHGTGNATIQGFDVNSAFFLKTTAAASGSVVDASVSLSTGSYGYKVVSDPGAATTTGDLMVRGVIAGTGSATVQGEIIPTGLDKRGLGSVRLTGANTYASGTSINAGSLILAEGTNRLPPGTSLALGNGTASGRLVLDGVSQTIADLLVNGTGSGNAVISGSATPSELVVDYHGSGRNFSGSLGGIGPNENGLSLVKSGPGSLTLSGTNTHTGPTTVQAGTLVITGSLGATSTTVAAGATFGGTGTIDGPVVSSGTLSPGAGGIGSLTVNQSLELAAGSSITWEINNWNASPGTTSDRIIAQSLAITASAEQPVVIRPVGLALANFSETSATFPLVQTTGGITGFAADKFVVDASGLAQAQGTWAVAPSGGHLLLVYTRANVAPVFTSNPILLESDEGSPLAALLTANDPDPAESLAFEKVSGPSWLAVAPDGSLSGTPGPADTGTNEFLVLVRDSLDATGTAVLRINVRASMPSFAAWAAGLGLSGAPEADEDGDGLADALEFTFGSDPRMPGPSPVAATRAGENLVLTFPRRDEAEASDLVLRVEAGSTLFTWPRSYLVADTDANSSGGVTIAENDGASDTITVTIPTGGAHRFFARLRAESVAP